MERPSRPRQHQLETESRVQFEAHLPPWMAYRSLDIDYGVDGEIEIFDPATGAVTGGKFNVQLKGTDSINSPSASVASKTWEYYKLLEAPTLIVLWHSHTQTLYVRWAHSRDPHPGLGRDKKSTFGFSPAERWTPDTGLRLERDLAHYNMLRSPTLPLPLRVGLEVQGGRNGIGRLMSTLARVTGGIRGLLRPSTDDAGEVSITITFWSDRVTVSAGGATSCTFHHRGRLDSADAADGLIWTSILGVAATLTSLGQMHVAASLAAYVGLRGFVWSESDMVAAFTAAFVTTERLSDAIELASNLAGSDDEAERANANIVLTGLLFASDSMSPQAANDYLQLLATQVDLAEEGSQRAGALYTLASFQGNRRLFSSSFASYRRAAASDPGYWSRYYFLRDLGALLFMGGRYQASATYYGQALALAKSERSVGSVELGNLGCALADACALAGQYRYSLALYSEYLGDNPDAEWVVKERSLRLLSNDGAREAQARSVRKAMRAVDLMSRTGEDERARLEVALGLDRCCALAWFNLGIWEKSRDAESAYRAFFTAFALEPWDVEAWR